MIALTVRRSRPPTAPAELRALRLTYKGRENVQNHPIRIRFCIECLLRAVDRGGDVHQKQWVFKEDNHREDDVLHSTQEGQR